MSYFCQFQTFFNYESSSKVFKDYIVENYELKVSNFEKIKFISFPLPHIELTNVIMDLKSASTKWSVEKLKIYPKFTSIYNHQNFQSKKLVFEKSNIILDTSNLNSFFKKLINQKNKIYLNDLNIKIKDNLRYLGSIENINFTNFGYKKNIIKGYIFGKKFRSKISDDLKNINFKLLKSGFNFNIILKEKNSPNSISGIFKSKILNSNLKFNFNYDEKNLNITKLFFRSKNLSFKNKSYIKLKPFLYSESNFEIEEINPKNLKQLKIDELLSFKNLIKQINISSKVNLNSKKLNRKSVENFELKFDLAYGRLNYLKNFSHTDDNFKCIGNLNLLDEYPVLFFDCLIKSKNKRNFLKKFNIRTKDKKKYFFIKAKGKLNILNKKINFEEISMNEKYNASKEDLIFFKEKFENILLSENFVEIFNLKKLKRFILEIS